VADPTILPLSEVKFHSLIALQKIRVLFRYDTIPLLWQHPCHHTNHCMAFKAVLAEVSWYPHPNVPFCTTACFEPSLAQRCSFDGVLNCKCKPPDRSCLETIILYIEHLIPASVYIFLLSSLTASQLPVTNIFFQRNPVLPSNLRSLASLQGNLHSLSDVYKPFAILPFVRYETRHSITQSLKHSHQITQSPDHTVFSAITYQPHLPTTPTNHIREPHS
jgi:hypothetical protein